MLLLSVAATAAADDQAFAVHGQFTYVEQATSGFNAPYRGANSLSPNIGAETTDATLYLGARLWPGAEAWFNGELDQGHGLDDTLGAAGFPSGEANTIEWHMHAWTFRGGRAASCSQGSRAAAASA